MRQRFGIGYDSHVFGANKKRFILGGVEIENETGLKGHSDCDAVAHAIIDALLGAVAMGDIGQMFPDTDKRWKDADSIMMLSEVKHRLVAASYNIVNVDATIVIEKPRMAPYINGTKPAMVVTDVAMICRVSRVRLNGSRKSRHVNREMLTIPIPFVVPVIET